jgi:uncharacterized YigZ family protein
MLYVKTPHLTEDIIKKSRFIGFIAPCANENEVLQQLKHLHSTYPDATHIAYAYQLKTDNGLVYRFHDAGEPTGTAGKPIFQHLEGKQLINVLVAVIRYFGGVKLGAGGLTRAYGQTARQVIEAAELFPYIELITVNLTLDYKQVRALDYWLKKHGGEIVNQTFVEQVRVAVRLPIEQQQDLLQAFSGGYSL